MEKSQSAAWTFLSNHTHILICLGKDPHLRVRDISSLVGITERAVLRILSELEDAGAVSKIREGRRNHYALNLELPLRHPLEAHRTIGELMEIILK